MTPQERQLVDDLFDRLATMETAPRDPEAVTAIAQGLRTAPNAIYALVQTVLVQDEALKRANSRIQELEGGNAPQQGQGGGFLDTMRGALLGQDQAHGSVPNVRPPESASRPVWNSGQVLQQSSAGQYEHDERQQGGYGQSYGGGGQSYGGSQAPMGSGMAGGGMMGGGGLGSGGSFLGTAAASAAGMVGGSLLLNSIRSMMGGSRQGFGDANTTAGRGAASQGPWTDQSGSNLARDAGINNIGSSGSRADDNSRAGLFDSASNDDEKDDADMDADDFDGDDDDDNA